MNMMMKLVRHCHVSQKQVSQKIKEELLYYVVFIFVIVYFAIIVVYTADIFY
jgi:hypothetical protein